MEILLLAYVEGRTTQMQFISHDPDGPQVHLFVVLFALKEFWRKIERSSTKSGPQFFFLVYCPTEVTQFYVSLTPSKGT